MKVLLSAVDHPLYGPSSKEAGSGKPDPCGYVSQRYRLWFRVLQNGKSARGVTDALAAYRQRTDSQSAGKRSNWMITCAINLSAQEKGDYALLRVQGILS